MRSLSLLTAFIFLVACAPAEKEILTTSVDVDQTDLQSLVQELDGLTDNDLPVDKIIALAIDTPMDEELQDRYLFVFDGADEDVQIHVWREQVDWVHLYFSTSSKELKAAIEETTAAYARQ